MVLGVGAHEAGAREAITIPFSLSVQVVAGGTFEKSYEIVALWPLRTRDGVAVTVRSADPGQVAALVTVTGVQEAEAFPLQFDTARLGEYCPPVA